MISKQYRISKLPFKVKGEQFYRVDVTHGLLDTEPLGVLPTYASARQTAIAHAKRTGVNPLILTGA